MPNTVGIVREIARFKKTIHIKVDSEEMGTVSVILRKGTVKSSLLSEGKKVLVKSVTMGNTGLIGNSIRKVDVNQKKENPIRLSPQFVRFR